MIFQQKMNSLSLSRIKEIVEMIEKQIE